METTTNMATPIENNVLSNLGKHLDEVLKQGPILLNIQRSRTEMDKRIAQLEGKRSVETTEDNNSRKKRFSSKERIWYINADRYHIISLNN